jgi:glutamate 5-kinase
MNVMLNNGILPIINENDTVSITELMFTDNDELAGLVASMMNASVLVILTNVDGIFNGPPDDVHSRIIPTVYPGRDLSEYINDNKSDFGRGGMITKCTIARRVADEGIRVIIANGMTDDILIQLSEHPMDTLHTEFVPNPDGSTSVKKWIAHSESFSKGSVTVNAKAADALQGDTAASLLMVGVTAVDGDFAEGDIIDIMNEKGEVIALGRSAYSAEEAKKLIGKHEIKPIVHYDYLYIK